jgi:hypothetical protein
MGWETMKNDRTQNNQRDKCHNQINSNLFVTSMQTMELAPENGMVNFHAVQSSMCCFKPRQGRVNWGT